MESGTERDVYLPSFRGTEGHSKWIDYQTGEVHDSGWQTIKAGKIPCVILVRDGSLIPHAPLAQRTDQIQWDQVELKAYKANAQKCTGLLYKPGDAALQSIEQ